MTAPRIAIVGAGPGDPELLTMRAVDRLRRADLVFYDGLVPEAIVDVAARARRLPVSRRDGPDRFSPQVVASLMIEAARAGERVVRLRAGDPFVLARGAEEALRLVEADVPFEVVPGLTSALAAPALAGIPLTHRGLASGFLVVSGHAPSAYEAPLAGIPPGSVTVVILMGLAHRAAIASHLRAHGWSADTPAGIVTSAGWPDQASWRGVLADLAGGRPDIGREAPGVIVIGDVVNLAAVIGGRSVPSSALVEEPAWQR